MSQSAFDKWALHILERRHVFTGLVCQDTAHLDGEDLVYWRFRLDAEGRTAFRGDNILTRKCRLPLHAEEAALLRGINNKENA